VTRRVKETGELSGITLEIDKIGQKMVNCSNKCPGVAYNPQEGFLPRCLILEIDDRALDGGTVICGINPGNSNSHERSYYIENGKSYDKVKEYWKNHIQKRKYYSWLKRFVDQLGFSGPILWTELVKCSNAERGKMPPLQTFRVCTKTYLSAELGLIPNNWPLIAVGGEVYKALAYRFPNRIVIGTPHVTGAFGYFPKLFDKNGDLYHKFKLPCNELWDGKDGKAIWFDAKNRCIR